MACFVVNIDGTNYQVDTEKLEIFELKEVKPVSAVKEKELLVKAFEILSKSGKIKLD